jgi:hypothetical protein
MERERCLAPPFNHRAATAAGHLSSPSPSPAASPLSRLAPPPLLSGAGAPNPRAAPAARPLHDAPPPAGLTPTPELLLRRRPAPEMLHHQRGPLLRSPKGVVVWKLLSATAPRARLSLLVLELFRCPRGLPAASALPGRDAAGATSTGTARLHEFAALGVRRCYRLRPVLLP